LVIKKIGNFERQIRDFNIKQRRKFHNGAYEDTKKIEIGFTQEGFYFPFTLRFFHRTTFSEKLKSDTTYELKFLPSQNTQILFIEKYYKLPSNIFEFEKEFTMQVSKKWILMTYKIDVGETKNLGIILEKNQKQIRKFQILKRISSVLFLTLWSLAVYKTTSAQDAFKIMNGFLLAYSMIFFLILVRNHLWST
jgi:hypothetical protein